MRLLERIFANYRRFFDAVAADALYMESPFFNFCLERDKNIIAVLKGNYRSLLEDAKGLFSDMEPKVWQMDRRTIKYWQAGHKRWDIENKNFNTLVNDWPLNHCFKHDPTAILNFVLTLFIAFILIQSFYQRNLKAALRGRFTTLISLADELHGSLTKGNLRAPWQEPRARPPP